MAEGVLALLDHDDFDARSRAPPTLSLVRVTLTLMSGLFLVLGVVFATLAAVLHVFIFIMESLLWTKPSTWKRFGLASQSDAETLRPMALNQGFYNLFLALGVFIGFALLPQASLATAGLMLVLFCTASMLAASVVLVISQPKLLRAAVTQGLFPLLAVVCLLILFIGAATTTA
jgi:putative membrane protein